MHYPRLTQVDRPEARLVTTPWARRGTARRRAGTARTRLLPRGHLGSRRSRDRPVVARVRLEVPEARAFDKFGRLLARAKLEDGRQAVAA